MKDKISEGTITVLRKEINRECLSTERGIAYNSLVLLMVRVDKLGLIALYKTMSCLAKCSEVSKMTDVIIPLI